MKPAETLHGSTDIVLAADGSGTGLIAFAVGLVVVLVLVAAFWWGARRRARQEPPPSPWEQPRPPARPTHKEAGPESVRSSDEFPADGQRLTPHQLGDHGRGRAAEGPHRGTRSKRGV